MTLTGAASSDIDTGETLTSAWVQVDPNTDLPLGPDPTLVTLSSSTATSPTFTAPHFAASTTLKFRLVVTDAAPFNAVSAACVHDGADQRQPGTDSGDAERDPVVAAHQHGCDRDDPGAGERR